MRFVDYVNEQRAIAIHEGRAAGHAEGRAEGLAEGLAEGEALGATSRQAEIAHLLEALSATGRTDELGPALKDEELYSSLLEEFGIS